MGGITGRIRVLPFLGLVLLALLSLLEFAFPQLKWLTFPAMVAGIVLMVAMHLFYRAKDWWTNIRWLRSSNDTRVTDSSTNAAPPIEPE